MADAIQFTIGDTVSVFEGTHHVRGRRSTKFIGKVAGFDTEKAVEGCVYGTFALTLNPTPYVNCLSFPLLGSKCYVGEEGATLYGGWHLHASLQVV